MTKAHSLRLHRIIVFFIGWLVALIGFAPQRLNAQTESAAAPSQQSEMKQLIEATQPKMVKVFGAAAGRVQGYATGLLVSADGSIVTVSGVLLDGQAVRVLLHNGQEYRARVIRRDREKQLALLKITGGEFKYFELPKTDVGKKGDWVVALSNAFKVADKSEPLSATLGVISLRTSMEAWLNKRDIAYRGKLVLLDCITSNPGAGGGAVVTTDGALVGMVGKIIKSSETNTRLNYAVPSDVLRKFVENKGEFVKVTEKKSTNAELGIRLFRQGGRKAPAYIDRVQRRSPAAKAKLKPDDLVISLGGKKIGNIVQFEEVLDQLPVGQETVIVVKRGAELLRLNITPKAKNK